MNPPHGSEDKFPDEFKLCCGCRCFVHWQWNNQVVTLVHITHVETCNNKHTSAHAGQVSTWFWNTNILQERMAYSCLLYTSPSPRD